MNVNVTDSIADMLTRIRNANKQKHQSVDVPYSKIKNEIANILFKEGYISSFEIEESGIHKTIRITLKYDNTKPVIQGLKRISKPGLRIYAEVTELPRVLNGLGIAIISTSKGIVTDKEARNLNVGGEVMAYVW
ncbi:MAG: 30S ribosomal protein S8 [Clostridia bacterium]|nr:30S ribosomal protein S8 [Clostridia bacterium]MDD4376261.1 30S ribosomal protein S8 [Clostridia bacterium]